MRANNEGDGVVVDALTQAIVNNTVIGSAYVLAALAVLLFGVQFGSTATRYVAARTYPPDSLLVAAVLVYGVAFLAMLFLLGCGLHHFDLVFFGLSEHAGHGFSQVRPAAQVYNWMQVFGAPGFVLLAWSLYVVAARKLEG